MRSKTVDGSSVLPNLMLGKDGSPVLGDAMGEKDGDVNEGDGMGGLVDTVRANAKLMYLFFCSAH